MTPAGVLSYPWHYAENGLWLLEEGDRVEGSSGFPGSICLHPLHCPPLLTAATEMPFLSPRPLQRHGVCVGHRRETTKTTNRSTALLLQPPLQAPRLPAYLLPCKDGLVSVAEALLSTPVAAFRLTSKLAVVRSSVEGRSRCFEDAFSPVAGGTHVNAPRLSRLRQTDKTRAC